MTLAEWTLGAARGMKSFVCMSVRSGVGAGVVINGRLLTGSHGFAGETGYMVLPGEGPSSTLEKPPADGLRNRRSESTSRPSGFDIARGLAQRTGEVDRVAARVDRRGDRPGGDRARRRACCNPDGPVWPHVQRAFRETALREVAELRAAAAGAARPVRRGARGGVPLPVRDVPRRRRNRLTFARVVVPPTRHPYAIDDAATLVRHAHRTATASCRSTPTAARTTSPARSSRPPRTSARRSSSARTRRT